MHDDLFAPERRQIISQLCLEAGRLMENTSDLLALTLPADATLIDERLDEACTAADAMAALLAAAQVLQRRSISPQDQA